MDHLLKELDEKELTLWTGGGWIIIEVNGKKEIVWVNEEPYKPVHH